MGKPFFTKKQKAKMRERRKKTKLNGLTDGSGSGAVGEASVPVVSSSSADSPNQVSRKRSRMDEEEEATNNIPIGESSNKVRTSNSPCVTDVESRFFPSSASPGIELTTKMVDEKLYVLIPSDLSTKDSKKFRKDARRKLREQGKNTEEIEFVTREDMPSLQPPKKKRKEKEFPSIKELLKQKRQMEQIQKEEAKLKEKLNMIPEGVRSQYLALDCEMVGIGTDGKKSALARVSIVDWNHDTVLDTFVQVPIRVTDFRTHVSGVEPKHIKKQNAMNANDCRELVAKILKDKILVGHALTNDLKALMLTHPKEKIRDTAKYRPFQRYGNGKWRARKLRDLVKENLKGKNDFQEGEHDSVQDAKATMELFQLVYSQWEKELAGKIKTKSK